MIASVTWPGDLERLTLERWNSRAFIWTPGCLRIHVIDTLGPGKGGAQRYTSALAQHLLERGHEVTVFCHGPHAGHAYDVIEVPQYSPVRGWPVLWRAEPLMRARWLAWRCQAIDPRPAQPDVVVGMAQLLVAAHRTLFPSPPLIYLPHSVVAPLEVRSHVSASAFQRWAAARAWARYELEAANRAKTTVRFTLLAKAAMEGYYGDALRASFTILPAPVELAREHAEPSSRNDKGRAVRLVTVGRLVATKNHHVLLQTLSKIDRCCWTLDVLGDGDERPRLEEMTRGLGLEQHVRFHGEVDDVGAFYGSADLHVFPSVLESGALVILEGMAHGLPSLAFRGDNRRFMVPHQEYITHGVDGFLASDEVEFSSLLSALIASPERLGPVRAAARRRVAGRHTWHHHMCEFERVLGEAVSHQDLADGAEPLRGQNIGEM